MKKSLQILFDLGFLRARGSWVVFFCVGAGGCGKWPASCNFKIQLKRLKIYLLDWH